MRKMVPKLSVIVPVYNVEKYIERCINSILNQSFTDFECILIDDGSPDNCGQICDQFAKKDSRIVVIHQNNQGASAARNAGLRFARGKYLSFIDSDDFVEKQMFDRMISEMESNGADVVICGVNSYSECGLFLRSGFQRKEYYDQEQLLYSIFDSPNYIGGGCCNKIFKNRLSEGIFFDEQTTIAEDTLYLFDYFKMAKNGVQIDDTLYNITERQNSATRYNELNTLYKNLESYKILLAKANEVSFGLSIKATDKFLDACLRNLNKMKSHADVNRRRVRQIRFWMIKELFISRKKLSKAKIHGYTYELVKSFFR